MRLRVAPILKKEFRQIARDRRSLGVLLLLPVFLLVMFGYAISLDVRHIPMAVYDGENSAASRGFLEEFRHSVYFDLKYDLTDPRQIDELMGQERIRAALVIPRDFSRQLARESVCRVQVLLDGSNASSASTTLGYIQVVAQDYSSRITVRALLRAGGLSTRPPVDYRPRVWYNPELRSSVFLVPGLITFILVVSTVISTALSIVREKERGTMEQIRVSPIRSAELIAGKTLPYAAISLVVTLVILGISWLLFGVTVRGSFPLLLLVIVLFQASCLGMGLLISTVAETQHMAFTLSALLTILPSFILSGFVFPIRNMPPVIQAITYLFPARYFLAALRGVIIRGAGLSAFWGQLLGLVVFGTATFTLSAARLRKGGGA